ncbi:MULTISPECIES: RNase adapter RapZ [Staphylococcaceae]|uniref:RNase adapter RapZ n=2 Tax=Macrococcus psychrotolerans TaxID=3039389 RepID=A0AAU6RA32_9STAP|nr:MULTISPECIES: RNase adapter RapZ [Macrococcus]MDJ1111104.1 RNase adapter RapZ [Macrococcus sp. S115]QYA33373.1 RNase adapter RapZ [Macrococcus sp. 19Msa1099]QYA38188.1 RNase adapter RapZ [Macrococcus caseolyticus]QYA76895.1 RNase adapter RapZ [Macrococcus caseolyticus]
MSNEDTYKRLVVVTGMSGAGKSVAIQCLEDLGYFCVDNLPPILLPKFIELMNNNTESLSRVAIGIDLRGKDFFNSLQEEIQNIINLNEVLVQVLFVEASDQILVSRYKETRRTHPLQDNISLIDAIQEERMLLADLRGVATHIIDTSEYKPKALRSKVIEIFGSGKDNIFTINVMSFGFKHGLPIDADIVFDVRFLPNPYYIEEMRKLTGLDPLVYDYVMKWKETEMFYQKLIDLLKFVIPGYMREGKSQVVIAIGCTGGQHRSVALSERISNELKDFFDFELHTRHRDALIEGTINEKA